MLVQMLPVPWKTGYLQCVELLMAVHALSKKGRLSFFSSQVFRNINFGDAKLYSCIFENMVFVDCNFGKTVLEYARIVGSKFIKGSEAVKYFERLFIEAIGICFAAIMVLTYGVNGNE